MSIFEKISRKFNRQPERPTTSVDQSKPVGAETRESSSKQSLTKLSVDTERFEAASANPDGQFATAFNSLANTFLALPQFTAVDWIAVCDQCDKLLTCVNGVMDSSAKLDSLERVSFDLSQLEALRRRIEETKRRSYQLDPIFTTSDEKIPLASQLIILSEQQQVVQQKIPVILEKIALLRNRAPALDKNFSHDLAENWLTEVGNLISTNENIIDAIGYAVRELKVLNLSIGSGVGKAESSGEYLSPAVRQDWELLHNTQQSVESKVEEFNTAKHELADFVQNVNFLLENDQITAIFEKLERDLPIPHSTDRARMVDAINLVNADIIPLIRQYDGAKANLPNAAKTAIDRLLGPTYTRLKAKATDYLVSVLLSDDTFKRIYPDFNVSKNSYAEAIGGALKGKSSNSLSALRKKLANLEASELRSYDSINNPADAALQLPAELLDSVTNGLRVELDKTAAPAKQRLIDLINEKQEAELQKTSEMDLQSEFLQKMNEIMGNPVMRFSIQRDLIKAALDPLDRMLAAYRQKGETGISEAQLNKLEVDIIVFKYKYTKRAIHEHLAADELKSGNHTFYFSADYDQTISDQGFKSLETYALQLDRFVTVPSLRSTVADLQKKIEQDSEIFKREYDLRRTIFFAERSMESKIFGEATSFSEGASRTFPQQAPEIFPTHDQFIEVVRGIPAEMGLQAGQLEELSFPGEKRYGRVIATNENVKLRDFNSEDLYIKTESLVTAHGEIMRLLDLLYSDRLYSTYEKALKTRGGNATAQELQTLGSLKGFFKEMHISTKKYTIPSVILEVSRLLSPTLQATELEIKQTWYFHTMLLNHAMLNPGESPKCDDQIYKAAHWLTYALSTIGQGVSLATLKEQLAFWGIPDPEKVARPDRPTDVPGKNYYFEAEGIPPEELVRPETFAEKIGFALTGESRRGGPELRDILIELFNENFHERIARAKTPEERKNVHSFEWLANLPLVVLHKNPISRFNEKDVDGNTVHAPTFRVLPMPMQLMVFKDTPTTEWKERKKRKEIRSAEIYIKRWGFSGAQMDRAPVTAADFFDDEGLIRYEMIPWEDIVAGGELNQYYNNLKNLERFRKQIQEKPSDALLTREELAVSNNDAKYAAILIPEKGLEVLVGRFKADTVFWQWTVAKIFARCIYLISSETKDLRDIKHKLWQVADVVGSDTIEVLQEALTKLFGTAEAAERTREGIAEQLKKLFILQR